MSGDIIADIENCQMVKNIPTGVSRLLKILTKDDAEIDDVIELLRHFPVICIRLIKVANSAWAAPKTEITDVKRACMQLGLKMVKSISIALLVSQQFNTQGCKGFSERKFWLSSLVTADLMFQLEGNDPNPENESGTAHLIGLIHNLGLLVIAELAPEKVSQALLLSENTETSFSCALEKTVGISYLAATQLILQNWEIPHNLTAAYVDSSRPSSYRDIFKSALGHKANIDLNVMPFKEIDDNEEFAVNKTIIDDSSQYDDLCGLYCR